MSTPILNKSAEAINTSTITEDTVFIKSKASQGRIYCQECFIATEELISVVLSFEEGRAVFSHVNCILCPPTPNLPEIDTNSINDWYWDPPTTEGEHCTIVHKYLNDWVDGKLGDRFPRKIRSEYRRAGGWDMYPGLRLKMIHDDETATVCSGKGLIRRLPLGTLWRMNPPTISKEI
ncbi:hypothetical protein [Pseudanabaena sp. 'Roaring Creek']|uniref:hypothetical protein n=1 Tax=Pseudanabaena sp. 'Roaring Creek' TaxID=1681830 RepID=UPI0006D84E52|nr:hypothetical protein [Pseudanabaena sp. 'Roaring Creek']